MPERRAAPAAWRRALLGLSICLVAATAAARVSEQYGPPIILMGLLIGLSLNFLTANPAMHLGLDVASKTCLRWGIVIPGFQVTLGQIGQAQFAITLVAISLTSAIAMLAYPPLADLLQLSDRQAGFLVGASIPDVARAVGGGYAVSDKAGSYTTMIKLARVALLAPHLVLVSLILSTQAASRHIQIWPTSPPPPAPSMPISSSIDA